MNAEEYRRAVGMDMLEAERQANLYRIAKSNPKPAVDQRKQADEQCHGVDGELLKGIVLGFSDSEGGETD